MAGITDKKLLLLLSLVFLLFLFLYSIVVIIIVVYCLLLVWVVAEEGSRESVDAKCRRLTATWVRERHVSNQDIEVCDFFEQLERAGATLTTPPPTDGQLVDACFCHAAE